MEQSISPEQYERIKANGKRGLVAIPNLISFLYSKNAQVRSAALEGLKQIGPPAVLYMVDKLKEEREGFEEMFGISEARDILLTMEPLVASATPFVVEKLKDPDKDTRWAAAKTLSLLSTFVTPVTSSLAEAINDEDGEVSKLVILALGKMDRSNPDVLPVLIRALNHHDWHIRLKAAKAIRRRGTAASTVAPTLFEELLPTDKEAQWEAAKRAIHHAGEPVTLVLLSLIEAVKDFDWSVQERDIKALVNHFGSPTILVLLDLVKNTDGRVRKMAVCGLGELGSIAGSAVPALVEQLHEINSDLTQAVVSALENIATAEALEALRVFREDNSNRDIST